MPFILGDFPFAAEMTLLENWFYENWPITKDSRPQPRLTFDLRETDKAKIGWQGTLSWGNGEISRELVVRVPAQLIHDKKAFELTKATFLGDFMQLIETDMRRWTPPKPLQPEVMHDIRSSARLISGGPSENSSS